MKLQHGGLKDAEKKIPRGPCFCIVQNTEEPGWHSGPLGGVALRVPGTSRSQDHYS